MNQIDQRIVDMQFNNQQFESGIKESVGSLNNLKSSLSGMGDSGSALSKLADGVSSISDRFSSMGIVALTVLQNITNRVVDLGLNMVKSLTLDPIMVGFSKYEELLTHTNTIMNATGKELSEVEEVMSRLNWYTDETSYSMTDMANNIGKFTAQGIDLAVAENAMEGIANWAAVSGQNAYQATIAMRNMSDAMGKGFMSANDWRSIEIANMATKEFKEEAIAAAIAVGQLGKNGEILSGSMKGTIVTVNNFKNTLSAQASGGWFSQEAMLETLSVYGEFADEVYKLTQETGMSAAEAMEQLSGQFGELGEKSFKAAQQSKTLTDALNYTKDAVSSGWSQTFKILVGDVEQAKEMWTSFADVLYEVFVASGETRNELLKDWADLGGRAVLLDSIKNAFEAIVRIITPIKEAFRDIFPPMTGERLFAITEGLKAFTEKLKIGDETADKIKRTFAGFFAVLDIVKQGLQFVFNVAKTLFGLFAGPASDGILGVTAKLGDFLVKLRDTINESGFLTRAFDSIKEVFTTVADKIENAVKRIKDAFGSFKKADTSGIEEFSEKVDKGFHPIKSLLEIFGVVFEGIVRVIEWAAPIVKKIMSAIGTAIKNTSEQIGKAVSEGNFSTILDILNAGVLTAIGLGIKSFVDSLTGLANKVGGILGLLDGVRGCLEAYQANLKAKTIMTIAIAIGILAASLLVLALIPSDKMFGAIAGMTTLFAELAGTMIVLQKSLGKTKIKDTFNMINMMIGISVAILILATAMKKIGSLDPGQIAAATAGIGVLMAEIAGFSHIVKPEKLNKMGLGLIAFATAILILSSAVEKLSGLTWEQLATGLVGVGILLAEIVGFSHIIKPEKMISIGVGMMAIAAAISILAKAVESLGKLDLKVLAKGIGSIAVILASIAGFTQIVKPEKLISTGIAMTIMGAALLILTQSVKQLGGLDLNVIIQGILGIAAVLAAVAGFTQIVKPEKLISTGIAMTIMGAALLILTSAIATLGGLDLNVLIQGFIGLAAILLAIAGFTHIVSPEKLIATSLAMVAMGVALGMIAKVIGTLGGMDIGELIVGLLALVGIFAVIGGAALILAPLIPVILGLSAAIALLGVGIALIGVGVLAFGTGMAALAAAGGAAVAVLIAAVTGLLELIPLAVKKVGEGFVMFLQVIAQSMPAIMEAVRAIALGLIEVLVDIAPQVVEALITFLEQLLEKLVEAVPKMVDAGMKIILGFLEGIANNMRDIVKAGLKIIEELLGGIAEGIPGIAREGANIIIAFLNAMGEEIPRVVDAGFQMVIDLINGIADTIDERLEELLTAGWNLAEAIIKGMVKGILAGPKKIWEAAKSLGQSAINGVKDFLGIASPSKRFAEIGGYCAEGLANGIKDNTNVTTKEAVGLGKSILTSMQNFLGIKSPAKLMRDEVGKYIVQGIAEGIKGDMSAEEAAAQKAKNIVDAFKTELDKLDISSTTTQLEYKLWEALAGETATASEKTAMQTQLLAKQFATQKEKTELARGEYQVTLETLGESSVETQKAYNKLLQEQIALADMAKQLNSVQKTSAADQGAAMRTYAQDMSKEMEDGRTMLQTLLDQGFKQEDIMKRYGLDTAGVTETMSDDVTDATQNAMETVAVAYQETAESTFGSLVGNFNEWGATYATAVGTGLQNGSKDVASSAKAVSEGCISAIEAERPDWEAGGVYVVEGFIEGIRSQVESAAAAAAAMARAAYEAAMAAVDAHSPSRAFMKLGMYVDEGFAIGIIHYTGAVKDAASEMGETALDSMSKVISEISELVSSDMDMVPTVRPVMDLTDVQTGMKSMSSMFSKQQSIAAKTSQSIANATAQTAKSADGKSVNGQVEQKFEFTQNNYSPKALSRVEIYRQTKNQFSALKGAVSTK